MKTAETTVAGRGRAIALEILRSASGEELARLIDLGLPSDLYPKLAASKRSSASRKRFSPGCGVAQRAPGLSGYRPRIYLNRELSELAKVSAVAEGLFEIGRSMALWDSADLDVWISSELPFSLLEVDPGFIGAYEDDSSMFSIGDREAPSALCSLTTLKRLVLQDA